MILNEQIHQHIARLKADNLYRKRSVASSYQNNLLHFSSNDYLSLARDERVSAAFIEGYQSTYTGSGGSMVICGYHAEHQALEQAFTELLGTDDSLLFPSGYAANLAIAQLLQTLGIHAFIDKGIHASLYDGLRLSQNSFSRYLHNNMQDFARKCRDLPEKTLIMTEGIFSMSGQKAALYQLAQSRHPLLVDEAHSFGLLGESGKGAVFASHLTQNEVPLRVIPLGKSCAGQGAIVTGQGVWIEALLQSARPLIYSTAMSPALAYGLRKTLDLVIQADAQRQKLQHLVRFFREAIGQSSLNWTDSETPIQQLVLGLASQALDVSEKLRNTGIICLPIRYPTVHPKKSGLRVVLNFHHEETDIQRLFTELHRLCR